jgi:hypothetical protein
VSTAVAFRSTVRAQHLKGKTRGQVAAELVMGLESIEGAA